LCTNHCKITIADIGAESEAYGFLCGRDYQTQKHVSSNTSGFDLIKERKKAFRTEQKTHVKDGPAIGIPAAIYMFEDLPLWKNFFELLSIRTVTSENYQDAVRQGKNISQAEFCAPVSAMHGHVRYLLEKADYVFLPFYLEGQKREKGVMRQYCYYSQYIPAVVGSVDGQENRILSPVVKYLYTQFHTKIQLYRTLKPIFGDKIKFLEISAAYDKAIDFKNSRIHRLKAVYKNEQIRKQDISVVFLGRPYTVLAGSENKGIPNIFASMGIKTFYQDMLTIEKSDIEAISPLLNELHWYFAAKIMEAAEVISNSENIYPVFITTFKCTPDSFTLEYFKHLMHLKEKPYLVLELDEHGSSVGYETRIEAAVRAFRNHANQKKKQKVDHTHYVIPNIEKHYQDKTIVIPNWDPVTCGLIAANLKREGVDAIVMKETTASIQKGVRYNTGQCIPLNAIVQAFVDTVEERNLDPEKTALWMFKAGVCSVKLFPLHMKHLLQAYGKGMEKIAVCTGEISFSDISVRAALNTYFAFMFGGMLRKMACKIRPYEIEKGETDAVVKKSLHILNDTFLGNNSKEESVREVVSLFKNIKTKKEHRPKVAIFGDIYVKDNDIMNQGLIHYIEENGGEVITTPYNQYCKMIAAAYFKKWFIERNYLGLISYKALLATVLRMEKTYYKYFETVINEPDVEFKGLPDWVLSAYKLTMENTGESMENVLKTYYIKKHHPDVSLFIQTSPAFCCPSLVTESMRSVIEKNTGIPVVSITYDGTGGLKNDTIIPYLKYPRKDLESSIDMGRFSLG
jgi:predicted nucleotide-binding protein (sugar kinase/HSP70/actin superfamily)